MKLTENFSLYELTRSETATRKGIANTPNQDQIDRIQVLCENILQPMRDEVGPIYISSGFRSLRLNKAIGGSATSQHCALNGAAVDIDNGNKNVEIFNYIKDNLEFDQLIWEFGTDENPSWVHVSYNQGKNRNQILKAVKVNGQTKYLPF